MERIPRIQPSSEHSCEVFGIKSSRGRYRNGDRVWSQFQVYLPFNSEEFLIHLSIWLLESRNVFPPEAQLDAFDVDLSQAPHHKWLPSNVSLRHWDMFTEVPEDLVAVYDVVHIRLVMLVLKDNNPVPLIQNLLKLLSKY